MNRSRTELDMNRHRHVPTHKSGAVPASSRHTSPIRSHQHTYELKKNIWPKQTVESWFEKHSVDERRAVYNFLSTLYTDDDYHTRRDERLSLVEPPRRAPKSPSSRLPNRVQSTVNRPFQQPSPRRMSSNASRASKRDLGEILDSLENLRPSLSVREKGVQVSSTPVTMALPDVPGKSDNRKTDKLSSRTKTPKKEPSERAQSPDSGEITSAANDSDNSRLSRRYLSQTWRVINPRDDIETNVRPENNSSSFFNYTKKVYPEYFFIHPDWY